MLLERGADPNLVIRSDEGPALRPVLAEYVASNENPSVEVVALLLKYGARVVIKTQFRDPHGILNSLQNTADKPRLLKALLEAAESFDPCMIRRSSSLTDAQKALVMKAARTPLPLTHQARLIVRKLCGTKLPKIVRTLQLPQSLHRYLLYDFHWSVVGSNRRLVAAFCSQHDRIVSHMAQACYCFSSLFVALGHHRCLSRSTLSSLRCSRYSCLFVDTIRLKLSVRMSRCCLT